MLIDEATPEAIIGRSHADAPDIDGVVHVRAKDRIFPGIIVPVRIEHSDAYDLYGAVAAV